MPRSFYKPKKEKAPAKPSNGLTIKDVKKGEYIKIGKTIYIRGDYNRSYGKYEAIKTSDVWGNPRMVKGSTPVDIEFEY